MRIVTRILGPILLLGLLAGLSSCRSAGRASAGPPKTTVTWLLKMELDRPLNERLVARFEEENPDIAVRLIWVPSGQYQTKLKTLIAARRAPDLFICGDVWVAYLLPFLMDITPFVERDATEMGLSDFYPELLQASQWNGRYYFLPRWFNISLLYYNRGLFDAAGVPYPTPEWTWDDTIRAGQKLTKKGPDGKVETWGSHIVTGWWGEWLILVRQSGGRMFNDEMTRCLLDTPEAIRGMQFYRDKVYRYGITPPPGFGPEAGFASGKMGMELGGHTLNWVTYNKIQGLDWDIEVLPAGPETRRGGEVAMDAIGISRTSAHPEAAWRFLKFLLSPWSIREHVNAGFLSVRRSIAEEVLFPKAKTRHPHNARAAYRALEWAMAIPRSPDYIEIAIDVIQPEVDRMLVEKRDPAECCRKAVAAANAFIATIGSERRERR
jgi:multiple sugar transport system substrate-binding protein